MKYSKPALKSKTLWGIAMAAIPVADDIYSRLAELPVGTLSPKVAAIVSVIGLFLAFVGRMTADKPIVGTFSKDRSSSSILN